MREYLFRGKAKCNGEWVYGAYCPYDWNICGERKGNPQIIIISDNKKIDGLWCEVIPETVGQYTGLTDKNGVKIFEGDIVQYITYDDFDCHSVVKFGKYNQDDSHGEYSERKCIGFYVEVDNFTCPDWCENEPEYYPDYLNCQNILEVASGCEVIGNIHDDDPELLKVGDDK